MWVVTEPVKEAGIDVLYVGCSKAACVEYVKQFLLWIDMELVVESDTATPDSFYYSEKYVVSARSKNDTVYRCAIIGKMYVHDKDCEFVKSSAELMCKCKERLYIDK